ncbi:MAG: stage III sporulation protein AB [Clostridia bacterium]|nr:stage III sporulation protein AB [Clostridia bacterium]
MTSVFGALLVTLACGAAGFSAAARVKGRSEAAEDFLELFRYILLRLPSLAPIEDIWQDFCRRETAGSIAAIESDGDRGFHGAFARFAEKYKDDPELYSVISRAGAELGNTDYRRQEQSLRRTVAELEALFEKRKQRVESSQKCYRWVGVLMGAALSLLML